MPNLAQFITHCLFNQNFIIIYSVFFLSKSKAKSRKYQGILVQGIEVQRDVGKKIIKHNKAHRLTETEKVAFSVCIKVHLAVRSVYHSSRVEPENSFFSNGYKKNTPLFTKRQCVP